jgi:ferredoxin
MEAELKFEREKRDGIAVVGSYLIDAAGRLGVEIDRECGRAGTCDTCAVTVLSGAELLSEPTAAERERLSDERLAAGERLSCQTKIAKSGEIVIMTQEKRAAEAAPESDRASDRAEEYKREFAELPLDQKIARLVELEAMAFSDTLSFVVNSPYAIGGKIVDILAGLGLRFDREAREKQTPDEHKAPESPDTDADSRASEPATAEDATKPDSK